MKHYSEWQKAFIEFITLYGHNYKDSYNLAAEFEQHLFQNRIGTYYLDIGEQNEQTRMEKRTK